MLLRSGQFAEVLALSDAAGARIGTGGAAAYDDLPEARNWMLDARARALKHLGRYDDAIAEYRRAVQLPERIDKVSQALNLADLLCELERPAEALSALPSADWANPYGKMQIALVQLTAAVQLGQRADADRALEYLRAHRDDSPATLQHALLRAADNDAAEQVLLSRLSSPTDRTDALIELQIYAAELESPARAAWRARSRAVIARPAVQRAVAAVGAIKSYPDLRGFGDQYRSQRAVHEQILGRADPPRAAGLQRTGAPPNATGPTATRA